MANRELLKKALAGDRLAIARLISQVERGSPEAADAMKDIRKHAGNARYIGFTGVGGGGKSTLICGVAHTIRKQGKRVGIIAIDPTSPFTGGAMLGDRVRMSELSSDEGVFIRSMGTRGASGGLAGAVFDTAMILDAAGFDHVIIETVGIGQDEVDITKIADVTIVVVVPGLGDSVQTLKAGIMEIGDIFVVNKADKAGAELAADELRAMIELGGNVANRRPAVLKTAASKAEGIPELLLEIESRLHAAEDSTGKKELHRSRLKNALAEKIKRRLMDVAKNEIESYCEASFKEGLDIDATAKEFINRFLR